MTNAYQKAGVDVTAGYEVTRRIQKQLKTDDGNIGRFGGQFALALTQYQSPVLVSVRMGLVPSWWSLWADRHTISDWLCRDVHRGVSLKEINCCIS